MKSQKEILQIICANIEKVLIKELYFGSCLPSTLIFWELAKKYNIEVKPTYGTRLYNENNIRVRNNIHFWNTFEDEIYDPTTKLLQHMIPCLDVNKLKYSNKLNDVGLEEMLMMASFKQFQATKSTEQYFSKAPLQLLAIRKKIHKNVKKCLK
jgi:hypothetical protein